jgi:hypothetical protein
MFGTTWFCEFTFNCKFMKSKPRMGTMTYTCSTSYLEAEVEESLQSLQHSKTLSQTNKHTEKQPNKKEQQIVLRNLKAEIWSNISD